VDLVDGQPTGLVTCNCAPWTNPLLRSEHFNLPVLFSLSSRLLVMGGSSAVPKSAHALLCLAIVLYSAKPVPARSLGPFSDTRICRVTRVTHPHHCQTRSQRFPNHRLPFPPALARSRRTIPQAHHRHVLYRLHSLVPASLAAQQPPRPRQCRIRRKSAY